MQSSKCADKLNGLLKGEISAMETYRQALEKINDPAIRGDLQDVQQCHSKRAASLSATIASMGETPAVGSGPWGAFAKLMEEGAQVFGEKAAIGVLEEGEDKGLSDYRQLRQENDPALAAIIGELLPKQEKTHQKMSILKHSLAEKRCH